jgi:hypothetical protein
MSSESVCQFAHSWVDMGSFHTRLVVRFMIFTASVRNILDTPLYVWVFGNMCTCIYCVLYCLYCVFVLFCLCIFILICFVCTGVRTAATE